MQPDRLAPALKALLYDVGAFMRAERATFSRERVDFKAFNDLVSDVDLAAEKRLQAGCSTILPDSGFIMEESGEAGAERAWRWIIDPLDGTTNFIHDIPHWCISVALQHAGTTVLGMVYDVPKDELFAAVRGGGATCNGQPIRVSGTTELGKALIGTGFPYDRVDQFPDYMAVLNNFMAVIRGMRRNGAAAMDLCWLACGRLDGFYEIKLNAWDVAAGALIVEEAGGAVSDFRGTANYVFGKQIAAGNPSIHAQMLEILKRNF